MSYLSTIKQGAIETWHAHRVLASVVGAQAALESGWGTSDLSKPPHNNHFGIKASSDWTGRTVSMSTREQVGNSWITITASFRAYDTAAASMKDYGLFFTSTPWRVENYKHVVGETDYKKACWALQNAGYATDKGYAQKLINIIENNNLESWDREAMNTNGGVATTPSAQEVLNPTDKTVGGKLTTAGREYIKSLSVTVIGDSLGVGSRQYLDALINDINFDVLGSRQITHATNSLNATHVLQTMKNAGSLKDFIVVIIGTNRGVTATEINNFVAIAGKDRKILFVDTASEVNHQPRVSQEYKHASTRHSNVFYVNWFDHAESMIAAWYSADGANGERIHMNATGYREHAEYIAQGLYESATSNFTERTGSDVKESRVSIRGMELNVDGIITYTAYKLQDDKTIKQVTMTHDTGIKGFYSPVGDDAIYHPAANQEHGYGDDINNSNWIETILELDDETDAVKLVEAGQKELIGRAQPAAQYTVSLLEIDEDISIGDTGIFIDHEFNPPLYIRARVLSITTSETNPSLNRVTIGNVVELHPQDKSQIHALMANLQTVREDLRREWIGNREIIASMTSSNGLVLGDAYEETQLMAQLFTGDKDITEDYKDFRWERVSNDRASDDAFNATLVAETSSTLIVRTRDIVNNQSKFVVRIYNDAEELIRQVDITVKRVETALWTEPEEPSDAKDGATWIDENGTQWVKKDGVWEERVDQEQLKGVRDEVEGAITEAEEAKQEAINSKNEAIAEAERLVTEQDTVWQGKMDDYDEQVTQAANAADAARVKADQALTDVGISTDLAQTAKDLATTAQSNANQATNDASSAKSQALNAFNLATSAKSDVSTISTTVDDLTSTVSLKADRTIVDQLAGTVSNHTNDISANAQAIQARLTSTQVNNLVDGKGFATQTWANTQINTTASGIRTEISAVENKIPTSSASTNLVLDSKNLIGFAGAFSGSVASYKTINMADEWGFSEACEVTMSGGSSQIKALWTSNGYTNPIVENMMMDTKYTASIYVKNTGTTVLQIRTNGLMPDGGGLANLAPGEAIRWSSTGVRRADYNWFQIHFRAEEINQNIKFVVGRLMVSKGDMLAEWSPAPQDYYNYANTKITAEAGRVEQLITQVKTNPAGTITGYNQLVNTHNSMQQAIGTNGEKIAQMVMTDSVFQTTVAKTSDVFKNYRVFGISYSNREASWAKWSNSRIIRPNSSLAPHNSTHTDRSYFLYVINEQGNKVHSKVYDVYSDATQATALANQIKTFTNRQYLIILLGSHAPSNNRTAGGLPQAIYQIGGSPEIFINEDWSNQPAYLLVGKPGLGQGRGYEYFSPASEGGSLDITIPVLNGSTPLIDSSIQAANSTISQLSNDISLRVQKGELLGQISLQAGRTLFQQGDNKLILTTDTFYMPSATIKAGQIENLTANKIVGNTAEITSLRTKILTANVVTSTHISADNALIDKLFATSALIDRLTSKTAFISQLKAIDLVADKASFLEAAWTALNSRVTIDGAKIRLANTAGDFAEMNNIPEFRSQDAAGTAAILGKGRSHYYSANMARFYIGTSLEGSATHGVHIAKGQSWGIYRNSDSYGGSPAEYYTVASGQGAVQVIEDLMVQGKVSSNFNTAAAHIRNLNGWPTNYWPVLQPGQQVLYKEAVPGNSSGVERIWTMGTSSGGSTRVYSHVHHVFEGGTTGSSDERLKHDIAPTLVTALDHIDALTFKQFKWNKDNLFEPLGLIAQHSGILRVQSGAGEMEGIDIQRAIMLALKGIQELQEEIKNLKESK